MTSKSSSLVPTLSKLDAIPPHVEVERQARWSNDRSSLDIPRGSSTWDIPSEKSIHQRQQVTRGLDEPRVNRVEPGFTSRQRPLSMGPCSPPRSPRISKSPPKPSRLPPKTLPSRPPSLAPLTPVLKGSISPHISTQTDQHIPTQLTAIEQPELSASATLSLDHPLIQRRIPSNQGSNKTKSIPPLVNRADKPKVPSKPGTKLSSVGRASLEPGEVPHVERVSPFSTPPSSDESTGIESCHETQVAKPPSSKVTSSHPRQQDYFPPPPPRHYSIEERNQSLKTSYSRVQNRSDPRLNGFSRTTSSPGDALERRPGLPPRPDSNNGAIYPEQKYKKGVNADDNASHKLNSNLVPSLPQQAVSEAKITYGFLPPPKRMPGPQEMPSPINRNSSAPPLIKPNSNNEVTKNKTTMVSHTMGQLGDANDMRNLEVGKETDLISSSEYPEASKANRRSPLPLNGVSKIETKYDTRLFDVCGRYICATGYLTKVWDVISGELLLTLSAGEKEIKVTSIAFKPGATAEEEGLRLWLGTNYGDIQEVDLLSRQIVRTKSSAHSRREIIKLYRYQNSMWSLDDDGRFHVWLPDTSGLPSLQQTPVSYRVPKGHTFSIIIKDALWLATGKEIRIFNPSATTDELFQTTQHPLINNGTGEVTSGAVISNQLDRVYFGHVDGKVTIYSTTTYACLGTVSVSVYKINSLAGAGHYLWAGFNTGMIYVYDTRTKPWVVKKQWHAHEHPVTTIMVNRSSVWKLGSLQVASIGVDNAIRFWDGMLEEDWLGENLVNL